MASSLTLKTLNLAGQDVVGGQDQIDGSPGTLWALRLPEQREVSGQLVSLASAAQGVSRKENHVAHQCSSDSSCLEGQK